MRFSSIERLYVECARATVEVAAAASAKGASVALHFLSAPPRTRTPSRESSGTCRGGAGQNAVTGEAKGSR